MLMDDIVHKRASRPVHTCVHSSELGLLDRSTLYLYYHICLMRCCVSLAAAILASAAATARRSPLAIFAARR